MDFFRKALVTPCYIDLNECTCVGSKKMFGKYSISRYIKIICSTFSQQKILKHFRRIAIGKNSTYVSYVLTVLVNCAKTIRKIETEEL